jgi:hypothetical protein
VLNDDYELSRLDILELSGRDALAAFFAKLGYHTNDRLVQRAAAMGFSSDALKTAITHIERLASEDGGLLEVYLVVLKSVTVSITRALVNAFRNLSVQHPLLILTDDYQRLDFVLVERYSSLPGDNARNNVPGLPTAASAQVGVGVRPRILTVNRLKPGEVELRVLRRFSYTESDSFAQYDKLLSAYDVADWSEPFFNNRALFSDYYLTRRLPESPDWKDPAEAAAMTRAFKHLRQLYADVRQTFANQPQEAVRARLLEPVFSALGFAPQPVKAPADNSSAPDYKLYAASSGAPQNADKPLALCLTYTWGRNLDGKDELRDALTPEENPGAVVVSLLDSSEADWAIVTNGKVWRLYSAKAHSRATNYYEIDLEETLALPAANLEAAFPYFWHFFRAAAFQPAEGASDGETRSLCFLDTLVSESERYARELGERLKKRVFEEIFPHFARGFIIYALRAGQLPPDLDALPADERARLLEPFFSGTLTFLYRLLFLLYAESRDLLPVREVRGYHEKSLERLKRQVAEKAGTIEEGAPGRLKDAYNELGTALYDCLQELFQAVDKGEPTLNVPVYNGGLFVTQPDLADSSPEAAVARFLVACKIPDRQLALGLDRMARDLDEKRHDLAFIDYKSLGVRQLGSIYEGLLEFKLCIAPEVMAIVKGKKTEETVPYAEAQRQKLLILKEGRGKYSSDKTLPRGAVYLENDRRERKATGSYYTPDYIVKYIVQHTVGPVLDEKLEALRPLFREAEKTLRSKRDKEAALKKQHLLTRGDDAERETYNHYKDTLNKAFFDIKVLDPAMGSGHFLVEAVDYITDRVADFLTAFRWNPVVYELEQTRREISREMEQQGVTIDMSKLTDLNLLKRRVLKSCIYGVDLNPMAVELAKVSLWLDCFTLGAPLSFLDHHMKCGNSLIGGSVQEVQEALSLDLWGSQFTYLLDATQLMRKVGELSDVTAQEVAASRAAYKGAYDALAPFKRLLDVYISEYFGNKGAKHKTRLYAGAIVAGKYNLSNPDDKKAIETALRLAETKRFFHWELEFPEVFFDESKRKDRGGFDAVVGNPPYGLITNDQIKKFCQVQFNSAQYQSDFYVIFVEQGIILARVGGFQGFIIPTTYIGMHYFSRLRQMIVTKTKPVILTKLTFPVFDDATVESSLIILQKIEGSANRIDALGQGSIYESLNSFLRQDKAPVVFKVADISSSGDYDFYFLRETQNIEFVKRLQRQSWNLSEVCDMTIGVKPYQVGKGTPKQTAAVVTSRTFDSPYKRDETYHRYLMGRDISKYNVAPESERWISYGEWLAEPRPSAPFFKPSKILVRQTADSIIAAYDSDHFITLNNLHNLEIRISALNELYILALLNSKVATYYHHSQVGEEGRVFAEVKLVDLGKIPIRRINFTLSSEQRAYYLEKASNLYAYCLDKGDQDCVLGFVDHHLARVPEESDVVHDLLAMLAEHMIRLNKEKRAAQRDFLDWLVATLKIAPDKDGRKGIDALTGKSKLLDYPGDYQKDEPPLATAELLEILQKNRGHLGVSLSDTGLVDRVRREYEQSLERVLPLKEQLAQTDRLIDTVVYRLYGLTEEEIAVVEGR